MAILGIDIGGTKCAVCLADDDGIFLGKFQFPTEQTLGPQRCLDLFAQHGQELLDEHQCTLTAIGISCGSPLDSKRGVIQAPPNLPSWKDVAVTDFFREQFSVECYLDNDANAGALAEFEFGAGRGCQHMAFLTFGTGLGAGLILNGHIYRGANCYAGEVGHLRLADDGPMGYGKSGSFEGFCSGGGIAQIAQSTVASWTGPTTLSTTPETKDVGLAAHAGDACALKILEISGQRLGQGLSIINDILNLERIIIGSVFTRCEEFLRPAMEKELHREGLAQSLAQLSILPAGLGEQIGDYSAIAIATHAIKTL